MGNGKWLPPEKRALQCSGQGERQWSPRPGSIREENAVAAAVVVVVVDGVGGCCVGVGVVVVSVVDVVFVVVVVVAVAWWVERLAGAWFGRWVGV